MSVAAAELPVAVERPAAAAEQPAVVVAVEQPALPLLDF